MNSRLATLFLALALVLPAAAQAQQLSALLTAAGEVPPTGSSAVGIAAVDISGTTVSYAILANDLSGPVTAAHVHRGAAGVNGPPVVSFNPPLFGSVTVTDETLLGEILANPSNFYVNVHTAQFPDGEIRGQLTYEVAADPGDVVSYLPIVGKTAGQGGTFFVTDVRMVNNSGQAAEVLVEFFPLQQGGVSGSSASATIDIAPFEQAVVNDIAAVLNVSGLGALRVTADAPVVAVARIINDQRPNAAGTTGFAFEARSVAEVDTAGILPFLSSSTDFRTNVGLFNPLPTPVTLTLTARESETGAILGSNTITVGGWGGVPPQGVFGVISNVPEANRTRDDFYVTWSATAPILVWASVTDNVTGDGVFVE